MNGYELSRSFWNFSFDNPETIKPYHSAVFFFAIEHCNRLGWKKKFGFPTSMAMEATGIKSYRKYKSVFDDLCNWGFFVVVELSKNQYSSNIISLSAIDSQYKAHTEALDKALQKHSTKQGQSVGQSKGESIDSINKQETIEPLNHEPINKEQEVFFENENLENGTTIVDFSKMGFKGRAKKIWSDVFPDYVWGIEDDSAIVRLESRIKEFIQNKKKNAGHAEFKATKQEIEETFEYLITHPPDFWSDKMSVQIVDKKINDFTKHAQNPVKLNQNGKNGVEGFAARYAYENMNKENQNPQ